MKCMYKSSAVLACLFAFAPVAFAQNKTVIIKYLNPKNDVHKTLQNMTRVPSKYARANELGEMRRINFQHTVLDGLEMEVDRQALQAATAKRVAALRAEKLPAIKQAADAGLGKKQVQHKLTFLTDYLATHKNKWPTYVNRSKYNWLLKRILNFMEVEQPTPDVLAVQQEIIRLRSASQARSPQELLDIVQKMLAYGLVPSRAYVSEETLYNEEELAIGEELAFAIAAYKVPMEQNPWQIDGMEKVVDQVTTYKAMRRVSALFEGLPKLYEKDGIHYENFPVWTQAEYAQHQLAFAKEHPFEYALAPYRAQYLGNTLPGTYNQLSEIEKQAIMFTTPGLETLTDKLIQSDWYNKAGVEWGFLHPERELRSFLPQEDAAKFMTLLSWTTTSQYRILFNNQQGGDQVAFKDLPYDQQVEFLRWAWQYYQLWPQVVLDVLYK